MLNECGGLKSTSAILAFKSSTILRNTSGSFSVLPSIVGGLGCVGIGCVYIGGVGSLETPFDDICLGNVIPEGIAPGLLNAGL